MSEQITVVLGADTAPLSQGFAKAQAMISAFDKKLADAGKGRSGFALPEMQITPAYLTALDRAAAMNQNLRRQSMLAGQAGKNGALGFLAFSQAVEDAQYGVRGVLNNIPQMVMGFGGGAGIAGALSLAAVAGYGAYRAFNKLSGIDEMEQWAKDNAKATEAFTAALKQAQAETRALQAAQDAANALGGRSMREDAKLSNELGIDESKYADIERKAAAAARARAAQDAIVAASGGMALSGETAQEQGSREWEQARLRYTLDQTRLTEDLATAQETLNTVLKDYQRVYDNTGDNLGRLQSERGEKEATAEEVRKKIGSLEAEKARAQVFVDTTTGSTRAQNQKTLDSIDEEIQKRQQAMAALKEQIALMNQLIERTRTDGDASKKTLDAKAAALRETVASIKQEQQARAAVAEVEKNKISFSALQTQEPELQNAVEKARAQEEATQALADELSILQGTVDYGRKNGEQLREEIELRREAAQLAQELGLSSDKAESLATQRRDLQKQLDPEGGGSIKERREKRSAERAAERERKRNERVAEAERARKARGPDGKPIEGNIKPPEDIGKILKAAEDARKAAEQKRDQNLQEQGRIQAEINKSLQGLVKTLAVA
jgi:hypothetical protein